MTQASIIRIQTSLTSIEHQTGSRVLASKFGLCLLVGEDQRRLIFTGSDPETIKSVHGILSEYSETRPDSKTIAYLGDLVQWALDDHAEWVELAREQDQETPELNITVEVVLTS